MKKKAPSGPLHTLPTDFKKALATAKAQVAWKEITPLGKNEWICWVTSAKKDETRQHRIVRACEELLAGKRRPCCWPGCPHRRPSAQKWFK